MGLPSDDEVREFAERIGALDEDGKYTVPRPRLVAGALKYREELAREADECPPTVHQLVAFEAELKNAGFPPDMVRDLVVSIAPALVEREGLNLSEGNPHP